MTEDAILATMFVVIALIIGAVSIAKPLIGRLGDILESYLASRSGEAEIRRGLDGVQDQLGRLGDRLSLLEERLDFTESLVARRRAPALDPGSSPGEDEEAGAEGRTAPPRPESETQDAAAPDL